MEGGFGVRHLLAANLAEELVGIVRRSSLPTRTPEWTACPSPCPTACRRPTGVRHLLAANLAEELVGIVDYFFHKSTSLWLNGGRAEKGIALQIVAAHDAVDLNEEGPVYIAGYIREYQPDLFIAGPAFNAGRYGYACATIACAVQEELGIPVLTEDEFAKLLE